MWDQLPQDHLYVVCCFYSAVDLYRRDASRFLKMDVIDTLFKRLIVAHEVTMAFSATPGKKTHDSKAACHYQNVWDKQSKETLCHAIKHLGFSFLDFMEMSNDYNMQIMLQESIGKTLEPFSHPELVKGLVTEPAVLFLCNTEYLAVKRSLVSGHKLSEDFMSPLLFTLSGAILRARMMAVIFFNEAFIHHNLLKKEYQERAVKELLHIIKQDDGHLCRVAREAIKNAAAGEEPLHQYYGLHTRSIVTVNQSSYQDGPEAAVRHHYYAEGFSFPL
ncbi:uncharacterized protein [Dendropsophus ebraccatus]|uniref:uncharacterized protein n=1 Tax=Dendropsophus ebraccatus TaxID=150705 RepID=UPI00383170E5